MEIAGAQKFANRPIDDAALLEALPPGFAIQRADANAVADLDPLVYEVVRHRLWAITEEMGDALKRMSGSVVVTDANDFNFAIMNELGDEVQLGLYNTQLAASIDLAVKWTLRHRAANPGIADGDMFLCNDPWVGGGIHQNDVCLFAPVFWEGELFGWAGATAHQVDLGGVSPGSWTPRSQNVFWESLPTPPVKMVRGHRLQSDVEDLYLRRSRMPKLVALDLRAKMGANHIAVERIRDLIRKYGAGTVKAVMQRIMDDAELRLRAKLRRLPDGQWRSSIYQEQASQGDRGLYRIALTLTKRDDHLTFDFRGTDPQSGMINCTYSGMRGGVVSAVFPMLCGDIPWSAGGLMRCFDIRSDEGTLNNATFPAGVCKASVASGWATSDVVTECLAMMMDADPVLRRNAVTVSCGTYDTVAMSGLDQRGQPFVSVLMDPMGGGFGASPLHDGVDTGGSSMLPMGRMPDAEMNEFLLPILYLWRREETDCGGPGLQRGGLPGSVCFIPHDTPAPIGAVISGSGSAVPMNPGIAGGYPGNTEENVIVREAGIATLLAAGRIPQQLDVIPGRHEVQQCETETTIAPGDAVFLLWQGGGGYGDPLLRAPAAVAQDVREYKVSVGAAAQVYGVVIDPDTLAVDEAATEAQRRALRDARRVAGRAA